MRLNILLLILVFFFIKNEVFAQKNTLEVNVEHKVVWENGERYFVGDIYLTPLGSITGKCLSILELRLSFDEKLFNNLPKEIGNNDLVFTPNYSEWDQYYDAIFYGVCVVGPVRYGEISYCCKVSENLIDEDTEDPWSNLILKKDTPYFWGTIKWKLLPSAPSGPSQLKFRIAGNEEYGNESGGANFSGNMVELVFKEEGVLNIDVPDDPMQPVEQPKDLAGLNPVCSPEKTAVYTVTRPDGVDSCAWKLSTDVDGENVVSADVADITVGLKGEKATILWKKTATLNTYYLQVSSVKGTSSSEPINMAVNVEGFPAFTLPTAAFACKSTELSWVSPEGEVNIDAYAPDYVGGSHKSPYTVADAGKYHFVRYRTAGSCKDTVDYTPEILNPQIKWGNPPHEKVERGEEITARLEIVESSLPKDYNASSKVYTWIQPTDVPNTNVQHKIIADAKSYDFEVYAVVDGCQSNTIKAHTDVNGGGILPNVTSMGGQNIACKDGGIMLMSDPSGGKAPYTWTWREKDAAGTVIAHGQNVWVTPKANMTYYVEVTDDNGDSESETIKITYKDVASPKINAGDDQAIVTGTYTYLCGSVTTAGAASGYNWNWSPSDKLATGSEQSKLIAQTSNLAAQQEFVAYVVDGNGCVSAPDSVLVKVYQDIADAGEPSLKPDDPSEEFNITLKPAQVTLCKNNSVELALQTSGVNLEGATYSWSPAAGLSDATIPNPVLTASDGVVSTDYVVTIAKADFKITRKLSVTINEEEAPLLQLAKNRMGCTGDVVEVVASGNAPDEYIWMRDGEVVSNVGNSYALSDAGEYHLKVYGKNANSVCVSDTLSVDAVVKSGATFADVTPDVKLCASSTTISFGSVTPDGSAFQWLDPDKSLVSSTDKSITATQSGIYYLVGGEGVCSDTAKINVQLNNVLSVEGLRPLITDCGATADLSFTSTTANTFVWLGSDKLEISGSRDQNPYNVSEEGYYYLELDGGDCKDTLTVGVKLNNNPVVEVAERLTTCGAELNIDATATAGDLYWSENADGSDPHPITDKVTGTNETKAYYVYADAGNGCQSNITKVEVSFGANPQVIADAFQTACESPYELVGSSTGIGGVKWYASEGSTTAITPIVEGNKGTSKDYWVCADDGGACVSVRQKVTVQFGVSPQLVVNNLQTTCENELELQATTTGGKVVWKEGDKELLLTKVTGTSGETKYYQVRSEDGKCVTAWEKVEVRFGAKPIILAQTLQTTCGTEYTLVGSASAGELAWYKDADTKQPLSSLTVSQSGSQAVSSYYVKAADGGCVSDVQEIRVAFATAPLVNVVTPQTTCKADAVMTLTATATGGELVWKDASGSKLTSTTVDKPGTYYVYAVDGDGSAGCTSAEEAVEVRFGEDPTVIVEPVQSSCTQEYTLNAITSGGELHWMNSAREEIAPFIADGKGEQTYTVYAQDGTCKSAEQSFSVKFGDYPKLTFDENQTTCETSLKLQASTTGGELVWKDNNDVVLATPQVSGNAGETIKYKVEAIDGTCKSAVGYINVAFGSKPTINVEPLQTACGTNYTLKATASEGAEIHWRADGSEAELSSTDITGVAGETATYWVYAEKDGCRSDEQQVTVAFGELPAVVSANPMTTCGSAIELVASVTGGSAVWTKANGDLVTNTTVSGTPGMTDTYWVYAQDGECKSVAQRVDVSFGAMPEVIVNKDITTCGEEYMLAASSTDANATVYWLMNDKKTSVTLAKGSTGSVGRYYVYAKTGEDCKSDTIPVDIHFGVGPVLSVVSPQTACGTTVVLNATTTAGDLVWKDGEGNTLVSSQVHGTSESSEMYYVTAVDGLCSSATEAVKVEYGKDPEVIVEPVQTVCSGDSYELQAVATGGELVWYQADKTTKLTSTTITKVGEGIPGIYYVEAQDEKCVSERKRVTVYFDRLPEIYAESRQTTCGNKINLKATASAGEVVWTDAAGDVLTLPQATGNDGEKQYYYVYAKDGDCESAKTLVEVEFGIDPEVNVATIQTSCGDTHVLTATASDGQVHWLETLDATEEMTSLTVNANGAESRTFYVYAENGAGCKSDKVAVTVLFGTSPMVTAVTPQTTCGETLQLTASTTGGDLVWKDAFGNVLTNTQLTQTTPGEAIYYVYADDEGCQSATKTVQVKFGSLPEVIADATQTTCGNEFTLSANASQGVLYYVAPDGTESTSGVVTGAANETKTYQIYAQGETASCKSDPVTVNVTFGVKPTLNVVQDQTTCESVLKLEATATGGEVFWMNSTREPLLLPQVTAADGLTYYVYAATSREETRCKTTEIPVNVKFGAKPEVTVNPLQTTCATEYTLQATASAGATLHWTDGETDLTGEQPIVTGSKNTTSTYWVYATKGECMSEKTMVTVAFGVAPIVTVAELQTSCEASMTLTASTTAGELKWLKGSSSSVVKTGPTHDITGIKGNSQQFYVYAEDGACVSKKIEVTASFGAMPSVLVDALQTTCGVTHTLTAIPTDGELHWLKADKTPLQSLTVSGLPNETTNYLVYAQKGEDKTCMGDTLEVTVVFGTAPQVTVLTPQTVCGNDGESTATIQLSASTTGGTLSWEDENGNILASTSQTADKNTTKLYYVQAEDNGCYSTEHEVEVKFGVPPEVQVEPLQTACGTQLELKAQASAGDLIWLKGKTILPSPIVKMEDGDTYFVRAKDGTCQSAEQEVKVLFETAPVVTVVTPQTSCGKVLELQASTTGGKLIWEDMNGQEVKVTQISGTKNTEATYFVYAQGDGCQSAKEMVQLRFETGPEVVVEPVQTACGNKHVLTATATAGELIWLEGDNKTPLLSTTVTGSEGDSKEYYVYAKAGDCAGEHQKVTVHFGPAPTLTVTGLQTTCEDQLTLQASTTGGELIWKNEAGEVMNTPVAKGVGGENAYYYVTAVDGECRSSEERVEVRFGATPEVIADALQTTCGTEYQLKATATSGKLNWFASNETTALTSTIVTQPGGANTADYYVQAQNGKCIGNKQKITVAFGVNPILTIVTPQTTCDSVITLKANTTGGQLVWMDQSHGILNSPVVKGKENTTATYFVKAQNEDGSCPSNIEELTVHFGQRPSLNVVSEQTTCGKELELIAKATGGHVYWLQSDKETPLSSTLVSGELGTTGHYYAYAGDGKCQSDTLEVKAEFGADPQLVVVSPQTSCDATLTLQASATGGVVEWTRADGSKVVPPVVSEGDGNMYYVQAVDDKCVSNKQPVTVKFNTRPQVIVETLQTSCDTVLTLQGSVSAGTLVWEDEDGTPLKNTTVHGRGTHIYYAKAYVADGCESDEVKVKVVFESSPVLNVLATQTACETTLDLQASTSGGELIWKDASGAVLDKTLVTMGDEKTEHYTVYARDGKCESAVENVEVVFNEMPSVLVETLQVTCGTEYQLQAEATGGQIHWVNVSMDEISSLVTGNSSKDQSVWVYVEDGKCSTKENPIQVTVKFGQKPTVPSDILKQYSCSTPYKLQGKSVGGQLVWEKQGGKEIIGNIVDLVAGENIFYVQAVDENCSPISSSIQEKVIVTLSGKPELTLGDVHCQGDTLFAEEITGAEDVVYRWFVDGVQQVAYTDRYFVFAQSGAHTVKVVGENTGGCVSDTASGSFNIAVPVKLDWDTKPVASISYGNNLNGCVKVNSGELASVKQWNWLSPTDEDITGKCFNIPATQQEYTFKVYTNDANGCVSDTLEAYTVVTGFGVLDLTLESNSGTEICEGGSALLTAIVDGGKAPYTYEWYVKDATTPVRKVTTSSVADIFAVAPTTGVTYVVKVKDSQETPAMAKDEIALTMKSGAALPVADAGPDMTIRKNLQTVLKGGAAAGIQSYAWMPLDKLNSLDEQSMQYPLTAKLATSQKYQLYVTGVNGCVSLPDETVVYVLPFDGTEEGIPNPPSGAEGLDLVIQPAKDTICLGTERWIAVKDLIGNLSSSATYTWMQGAGLVFNTKQDSALFKPTAAGDNTFVVMVEDGVKKIALRSNIYVRDAYAPDFALSVTGNCQNDTVKMIYADGSVTGDQLTWKVKGTAVSCTDDYYVLTNTGSYTVEVSAGNNLCQSTVKSVAVTVNEAPQITDFAMIDSCGQAVVEVKATGNSKGYTWTATPEGHVDDANPARYVIGTAGQFVITVTASNENCSVSQTLDGEVFARPGLDWITEPADVAKNASIVAAVAVKTGTGTPAYTYHWLQPDAAQSTVTGSYTVDPAELASYTFEVYASDSKGCMSDTLKKTATVSGGDVKVEIQSVYGNVVCKGGAAMLVAHAQGVEGPCVFQWMKKGSTKFVQSGTVPTAYDTLWVKEADVAEYIVNVKKESTGNILAQGTFSDLTVSSTLEAPVVAVENDYTIPSGGHTVLLSTVTKGTAEYNWHWSPADRLVAGDAAVQYPLTVDLTEKQVYQVYVTDANSCVSVPEKTTVSIHDQGLCVNIDPQDLEICRGNTVQMVAKVDCGMPEGYDPIYTWLPADESSLLSSADKDTVIFTPAQEGKYTWLVKVKNSGIVAVARTLVTVRDADAPMLALEGNSDCVGDTLIVKNSGEVADKYVWNVDGLEAAETGERLVLTGKDIQQVKVFAEAANGCKSDILTRDMQLGIIPEVEIASGSFVNFADSVTILKVKQNDNLLSGNYEMNWTTTPGAMINGAMDQLSAKTMPMSEDVKFRFEAVSKDNALCRAADSVTGYLIPKAAKVDIDKDEATGNLILKWNNTELALADSVRVMNIKWDGYAVASEYKPEAMVKADLQKYIIDSSKDTLEFFYINASRYIAEMGKSYYSLASDTVGYMKQWLYKGSGKATDYNFMTYIFDMSYKGIIKRSDLLMFAGISSGTRYNIQRLSYWSPEKGWLSLASANNGALTGEDINLKLGDVFRVEMRATTELVMYGKLPPKFTYTIAGPRVDNYVTTPLSYGHIVARDVLGEDISTNIYQVGTFSFKDQSWYYSTRAVSGAWTGSLGNYRVSVFMPLQIILRTGNLPNWTK